MTAMTAMTDRTDASDAATTLARWQADEDAVRARNRRYGLSRPEQLAPLSGQQFFDAMFDGDLPLAPIFETLDFVPIHMARGVAVFQGRLLARHYNPMGTVHGGWFATLLDSAVACAVHTALPAGKIYTTVELKVSLVKALTDKVPLVRAEGRLIHLGRSLGTADGRLVGPDGTLYAHASTTCFVLDRPPAP